MSEADSMPNILNKYPLLGLSIRASAVKLVRVGAISGRSVLIRSNRLNPAAVAKFVISKLVCPLGSFDRPLLVLINYS